MKSLCLSVFGVCLLTALPALAERPDASNRTYTATISAGELTSTPDMWFYEQYMQQYQDPKMAVRKRAEFESEQRARRLAAMRWYGMSNSRPRVSSDPYHGDYSAYWGSNNAWYPSRWSGVGRPVIVIQQERPTASP